MSAKRAGYWKIPTASRKMEIKGEVAGTEPGLQKGGVTAHNNARTAKDGFTQTPRSVTREKARGEGEPRIEDPENS